MKLCDLAARRDNNLNLIRAIAAIAVLVSHAYPIALGAGTPEPLSASTGRSLGGLSVYVFFVISGFLITQSFDRASSWQSFLVARVLRLMPGLVVNLLLVGLIVGPLVTTVSLNAYLKDPTLLRFIFGNASLLFMQYQLPGVFEDLPYTAIVGSIWTLFYEVLCYVGVFVLGLLGLIRRPRMLSKILLVGFGAIFLGDLFFEDLPWRLEHIQNLTTPFIFGMLAYLWRQHLLLVWWLLPLMAMLPVITFGTAVYHLALCLALSYWTLWLGFVPGGAIRRFNDLGDYSYGIYVYAFPVQGLAVYLIGPQSAIENIIYSLPVTILLGVLSWYIVEKPAMAQKNRLAQWITPRAVQVQGKKRSWAFQSYATIELSYPHFVRAFGQAQDVNNLVH